MKIVKIIIIAILIILTGIILSSCNRSIVDTNYTFDIAIISRAGGDQIVKIKKWKDYEGEQYQLVLEDDTVILVSSYNTILVNSKDGNSIIFDWEEDTTLPPL